MNAGLHSARCDLGFCERARAAGASKLHMLGTVVPSGKLILSPGSNRRPLTKASAGPTAARNHCLTGIPEGDAIWNGASRPHICSMCTPWPCWMCSVFRCSPLGLIRFESLFWRKKRRASSRTVELVRALTAAACSGSIMLRMLDAEIFPCSSWCPPTAMKNSCHSALQCRMSSNS